MESKTKSTVRVQTRVSAPVVKIWKYWTTPEDIIRWNNASDDWHTPWAENDLRKGGKFSYRMEARDGSQGFDLWGVYDNIKINKQIDFTLGDGRKVNIVFSPVGDKTEVLETFETENENSIDLQRKGWQSILNNFKKYVESKQK